MTGTRQLAERVEEETQDLGLEVVRFAARNDGAAKLDDYHQAQAIGVMNYWAYFNSKPVPQPTDLVIFDDAHLAEQPLSGLQTIRVPDKIGPARELYRTICDLVVAPTDAYPGLRDARRHRPTGHPARTALLQRLERDRRPRPCRHRGIRTCHRPRPQGRQLDKRGAVPRTVPAGAAEPGQ